MGKSRDIATQKHLPFASSGILRPRVELKLAQIMPKITKTGFWCMFGSDSLRIGRKRGWRER